MSHHRFTRILRGITEYVYSHSNIHPELAGETGKCARKDKEIYRCWRANSARCTLRRSYSASQAKRQIMQAQLPNPAVGPARWRGKHKQQKKRRGRGFRIRFYSLDCCSKEENCFDVCKSSFCSSRQMTIFYTTTQVLCTLLIYFPPFFFFFAVGDEMRPPFFS